MPAPFCAPGWAKPCSPASKPRTGSTYDWKLASGLPESHPIQKALVVFADKVKEKTMGEAEIKVFPTGQLGQEKDCIEGLKIGPIEFTKVSSAPMGQFSKSLQVASQPFIWRNIDHQHKLLGGVIGKKLMADLDKTASKCSRFWMRASATPG
jgi:TRAP-type C4-dicarboxylate transport system substrate-binding protein